MDIFDEEILKFWKSLNNNNVKYIMVGGYATNIHGFQRYTGDIDIWIEDTIENRNNLRAAFIAAGMGDYFMLPHMQFVPGWSDFMLNNGLKLDILIAMKGLEGYTFNECLDLATIADFEGLQVPFIHLNHLIANKKAVNRPKDQIDVIELEKIKKIRDKENNASDS
jgi:predicted nucleotidyltransferase